MAVKEFPAGEILFQNEQPVTAIHLITKGTVRASYPGGEFQLTRGNVIGICELHLGSYYMTYQAEDAVALAPYPCTKEQLAGLMGTNGSSRPFTDSCGPFWINISCHGLHVINSTIT